MYVYDVYLIIYYICMVVSKTNKQNQKWNSKVFR